MIGGDSGAGTGTATASSRYRCTPAVRGYLHSSLTRPPSNPADFLSLVKTPLIVAAEHEARGTADALLMANADTAVRYGENELSSLDSAASVIGYIS